MSRSRLAAAAAALALAAGGCSAFDTKPGITVKAVTIDLAFGGKTEKPAPQRTVEVELPIPVATPPESLPQLPSLPGTLPGTEKPCRPPSPFPEEPAPPAITAQPELGRYHFSFSRTEGGRTRKTSGFRTIENLRLETRGLETIGFSYDLVDDGTGIRMRLMVQTAEPTRGLFLQEVVFPNGEDEVTVAPVPAVQILEGSLVPRDTAQGAGIDPLSGAVVESASTVLDRDPKKDRIKACDEVVDAWRATWTLDVTGPLGAQTLRGTVWFATQWGGWPVADRLTYEGDFVAGAVASTITRAKPEPPSER